MYVFTWNFMMVRQMIPAISAIMESTMKNRNVPTRQGLSEAPPTQPTSPEKKRVNPRPMTTYVKMRDPSRNWGTVTEVASTHAM